jgi:hypothetical protein
MQIAYVNCPLCRKSFHCDAHIVGSAIPLHCPHCDAYFEQEKGSGNPTLKGAAFAGLVRVDRDIFYLPAEKNPQKRGAGKK